MSGEARDPAPDALLVELWPRARPILVARLDALERCVAAWRDDHHDAELWQVARRHAHALAGSLAMLGHPAADPLARDLYRLLRDGSRPDLADAAARLVASLRRELNLAPAPDRPSGAPAAAS